ncbi:hypothetical protein [Natronorubrum daqingense]|uniref:Uncharacterized protein n=1 Tax=Natronorubrum daqingense TaxID=588898 RepID=A0A1N7FHX0_9EURY|nr:hypothetical protein [Natronorubrum daqingense]APX98458.1 hypothetical protein BB347_17290 [Natronorubrum daqingense]SIR99890.1 hypothetical protein SAMN05421809_3245 [Natronorubrum daqingense]
MNVEHATEQVRDALQQFGMNPDEIRYAESRNIFYVHIGVNGTAERYFADVGELGGSDAVSAAVDPTRLQSAVRQIDGTEVSDGRIHIDGSTREAHFQIRIE